jgi:AcrR family transcriptional regulator
MRRLPADRRRAELLDATVGVLLEKGLAHATTRDLAEALGIGRGLIHHYFPSWQALRREAFLRLAERELAATDAALSRLEPPAALEAMLGALVPDPDDRHWQLWSEVWDEAQRDPELAALVVALVGRWHAKLAGVVRQGVAGGAFACPDPDGAAWRLIGLADGLGGYLFVPAAPLGRDEVLAHLRLSAAREVGSG